MEVSIYDKYIENYSNKISKLFEEIDKLEEYIQNVDELKNKFKKEKGYSFLNNGILFKI